MVNIRKALKFQSRRGGSNPRPADYESAALPLSYAGLYICSLLNPPLFLGNLK